MGLCWVVLPRLDRLVWGFARFLVAAIEVLDRLRTFLGDKAADGRLATRRMRSGAGMKPAPCGEREPLRRPEAKITSASGR